MIKVLLHPYSLICIYLPLVLWHFSWAGKEGKPVYLAVACFFCAAYYFPITIGKSPIEVSEKALSHLKRWYTRVLALVICITAITAGSLTFPHVTQAFRFQVPKGSIVVVGVYDDGEFQSVERIFYDEGIYWKNPFHYNMTQALEGREKLSLVAHDATGNVSYEVPVELRWKLSSDISYNTFRKKSTELGTNDVKAAWESLSKKFSDLAQGKARKDLKFQTLESWLIRELTLSIDNNVQITSAKVL